LDQLRLDNEQVESSTVLEVEINPRAAAICGSGDLDWLFAMAFQTIWNVPPSKGYCLENIKY
jgi:hypothetical protein